MDDSKKELPATDNPSHRDRKVFSIISTDIKKDPLFNVVKRREDFKIEQRKDNDKGAKK